MSNGRLNISSSSCSFSIAYNMVTYAYNIDFTWIDLPSSLRVGGGGGGERGRIEDALSFLDAGVMYKGDCAPLA